MGISNEGSKKFRSPVLLDTYDMKILKTLESGPLTLLEIDKKVHIARKNTLIHVNRLYNNGFISTEMLELRQRKVTITERGKILLNIF